MIARMRPSLPAEKLPLPLPRSLKRHPTPTFSSNQEKFIIVIFDVKSHLQCQYLRKGLMPQALAA